MASGAGAPPLNGIFKGGGAKGIVYAGALRAVHARGLRFASVAGSSAGAITAVLVAADVPPEQLDDRAAQALRRLVPPLWMRVLSFARRLVPVGNQAWFDPSGLGRWIDDLLHEAVGKREDSPVTFAELVRAKQIDLHVVSLDLATKEPVVFCAKLTPDVAVADAALASSAIPVAMPPRRARVLVGGRSEVHVLVDGGAWANYPAFVYDPAFRAYYGLDPVPDKHKTVGFVIDPPPVRTTVTALDERRPTAFDGGSGERAWPLGTLLANPYVSFVVMIVIPCLVAAAAVAALAYEARRLFSAIWWLPAKGQMVAMLIGAPLLAVTAIIAVAAGVGALLVWREATKVGLPAMLAAVSVGPSVPSWIRSSDDVIRLDKPEGIKTTSFNTQPAVARAAIAAAHDQADAQLDALFPTLPKNPVFAVAHDEEELRPVQPFVVRLVAAMLFVAGTLELVSLTGHLHNAFWIPIGICMPVVILLLTIEIAASRGSYVVYALFAAAFSGYMLTRGLQSLHDSGLWPACVYFLGIGFAAAGLVAWSFWLRRLRLVGEITGRFSRRSAAVVLTLGVLAGVGLLATHWAVNLRDVGRGAVHTGTILGWTTDSSANTWYSIRPDRPLRDLVVDETFRGYCDAAHQSCLVVHSVSGTPRRGRVIKLIVTGGNRVFVSNEVFKSYYVFGALTCAGLLIWALMFLGLQYAPRPEQLA